jgi:putative nucleotidyltransferase with HDIG domain
VIAAEVAALAGAVAVAIWRAPVADWDLPALFILLALAIVADLLTVYTPVQHVRLSGSFLVITIAIAFLGPTPAALIGVVTILASQPHWRVEPHYTLNNLVTYAWFPLLAGIAFHESVAALDVGQMDPLFYLLVIGAFMLALAVNFALIAGYSAYVEGSRLATKARRALLPVLPSEVASALLATGIAYLYVQLGIVALPLTGIVLIVFQYLVGALLLSQQRAEELELRARQLAGFQVGLLSALIRTLDLRDRMTARHSAAVARYAREIAAEAGLPAAEQELAHTAGLLHDIGKFTFPDRISSGDARLDEDDWRIIRMHPYEGARIVSQVDGFQPVGDIILAHHERIDGTGYPYGLTGEEIPVISRVIAVADVYDALTAHDTYRGAPVSSPEAMEVLRRASGTQLDGRFVEALSAVLARKDIPYRHGEDADFDTELALEKRIQAVLAARQEPAEQPEAGKLTPI